MAITVPYKILAEGYKIRGGRSEPMKATVPYLVEWPYAFLFYEQILGQTSAAVAVASAIVRTTGHQLPAAPNLYADTAEIEPCGVNGDAPISATYKGTTPGEFFSHAKVVVEYTAPSYDQGPADSLRQLDPDNPITYCEQEVESKARFDTERASGWEFGSNDPVPGDFARLSIESRIVLTFPRVPFLPWRLLKPFVGRLNSVAMFDCEIGTLLLEEMRLKANETNQGLAGTSTQLVFAQQDYDWNKLRKRDGSLALVRNKADTSKRPYEYKDFRQLFL